MDHIYLPNFLITFCQFPAKLYEHQIFQSQSWQDCNLFLNFFRFCKIMECGFWSNWTKTVNWISHHSKDFFLVSLRDKYSVNKIMFKNQPHHRIYQKQSLIKTILICNKEQNVRKNIFFNKMWNLWGKWIDENKTFSSFLSFGK